MYLYHVAAVGCMVIATAEERFAGGHAEKPILGKERTTITLEVKFHTTFGMAPDGTVLATLEHSGSAPIVFWDVATGKEIKKLEVPDSIRFVFSPDGQTLAVGRARGRIALFDVKTGRERASFGQGASVASLAFSADGKMLATGHSDGKVRVWDVTREKELFRAQAARQQSVDAVVLSPDGKALVSLPAFFVERKFEPGKLWNVPGGEVKGFRSADFLAHNVAFTADGKKMLTRVNRYTNPVANQVQVWDPASGRLLTALKHQGVVKRFTVAPNNNVAAAYSEMVDKKYKPTDWGITIWDLDTGKALDRFKGHTARVYALQFSPDGKKLATYADDGDVKLWDLAYRSETVAPLTLPGPQRPGISAGLAFTADGRSLAAWSGKEAKVWWIVEK